LHDSIVFRLAEYLFNAWAEHHSHRLALVLIKEAGSMFLPENRAIVNYNDFFLQATQPLDPQVVKLLFFG